MWEGPRQHGNATHWAPSWNISWREGALESQEVNQTNPVKTETSKILRVPSSAPPWLQKQSTTPGEKEQRLAGIPAESSPVAALLNPRRSWGRLFRNTTALEPPWSTDQHQILDFPSWTLADSDLLSVPSPGWANISYGSLAKSHGTKGLERYSRVIEVFCHISRSRHWTVRELLTVGTVIYAMKSKRGSREPPKQFLGTPM